MKITVFNGSPRGENSNSHKIIKPLLEGAKKAGAETKEVFLIEKDIKQCLGCFFCWGKTPGKCAIKDDMEKLLDLYLESEYVGFATPVYGMYMTGLLKNFMDRFLPLATPHIRKNPDGSFYHDGRIKKFPKQFLVANSGFPGKNNFDLLKAVFSHQNMVLAVYRNSGEIFSSPESKDLPEIKEFFASLEEAGKEMIINGKVSENTIEKINKDIISDEDYMKQANQYWDQTIQESKK
jgi:multimeric flavodoxin WrbA